MHAFAHVTGGGLPDNLARVLPSHSDAVLWRGKWDEPRIFAEIQAAGDVADDEMAHVFNLGLGMLAIVAPRTASIPSTLFARQVRKPGSSERCQKAAVG